MRFARGYSRARATIAGCGCCDSDDLAGDTSDHLFESTDPRRSFRTGGLAPNPCAAAELSTTVSRDLDVNIPDIHFSAAHFVAFRGFREQLHGHNYTVRVRLGNAKRQLCHDGYIVDFGDVKRAARELCKELKGKTLIPMNSDVLQMQETAGQLDIFCEDGARFSMPVGDCAMLPIVHSTAEELAEHLWGALMARLGPMLASRGVDWCEVTVMERPGQGACYRSEIPSSSHVTDIVAAASGTTGKLTSSASQSLVSAPTASTVTVPLSSDSTPSEWAGASGLAEPVRVVDTVDHVFQRLIDERGPRAAAEAAFRNLLRATLGPEEFARPELVKTPARAAKAFFEQTSGLSFGNPLEAVGEGVFDLAESRDVVSVRDIQFHSLCEHHLLPFSGRAHFAYIPDGRILGLSKFARLLDAIARRPQVQERLTRHAAEALLTLLKPRAVAVTLEAHHCCMSIRGVLQPDASTRTVTILGPDRDDPATRQQLLGILTPSSRL